LPTFTLEPLNAASFAPFGMVHEAPATAGHVQVEAGLGDDRPGAQARLALVHVREAGALPVPVRHMERHRHSSQTFLPLGDAEFLVLVAPPRPVDGLPDVSRARAFRAAGGQGVTYAADTWHHPLTVLRAPARFAVWIWRDDGPEDEEFVDVAPFSVTG